MIGKNLFKALNKLKYGIGRILGWVLLTFVTGWVVKSLLDSQFAVVLVESLENRMHESTIKSLIVKNKANWFIRDGIYSQEDDRNATARERITALSKLCNLKVEVYNTQNIPKEGKLIVIANHDNTNGGVFLASCVDTVRNNDDTRVLSDSSWSKNIKLSLVNYDGFMQKDSEKVINEHLSAGKALVVFPKTGDYFTARQDKTQPTFRFMDGFLRFALDNECNILPANLRLEYPLWWRILWWIVPQRLGIAILHTFQFNVLSNTRIRINFGKVIPYSKIQNDREFAYLKRGKVRYKEAALRKYELEILKLMR